MKTLNRYFSRDARALLIAFQIRDLNKQISKLRKKQRKLFDLMKDDDDAVRQMFNDGVFDNYGKMTDIFFKKLIEK